MSKDRILRFDWNYDDYLAVTEREDNEQSSDRWAEVVDLIDNKHYESVNDAINATIRFVDECKLEENKDEV